MVNYPLSVDYQNAKLVQTEEDQMYLSLLRCRPTWR